MARDAPRDEPRRKPKTTRRPAWERAWAKYESGERGEEGEVGGAVECMGPDPVCSETVIGGREGASSASANKFPSFRYDNGSRHEEHQKHTQKTKNDNTSKKEE